MNIPFLDLVSQHRELKDELLAVCSQAFDTAGFIGGSMVSSFENEFAQYCGTKYCVAVNSGTDALRFAYLAAGIKPGDLVLTVPNTFIATTESISQTGATPVFIDMNDKTFNIDTDKLKEYLQTQCERKDGAVVDKKRNRPVTAIVPVHLYGQCADMDTIQEIADEYNLLVFEDACQAHGAKYFSKKDNVWKTAGSMSVAASFSFYPGKNLGACGEGGAVTTNDEKIAQFIRQIRDHGQAQKYYHDMEGYNGRLDAIQCGILSIKLKKLPLWTELRQTAAKIYNELLKEIPGIITPFEPEWSKAVYHLYVIRTQNREALQKILADNGVATALHYPVPLHLQKAYEGVGYKKGDFPVAEKAAVEILSLPMYPGLTREQQVYVVDAMKKAVDKK
ncbi:MAG: DegT/DnrJ/EryC1/StrS family aminotransferase [Fibrobacter sp.]|nr:DegT/DnrJ/EryC1/StrS family aminotransferase [Fibrobacter sp.]